MRYVVHNPAKETAKVSIAFSLDNPAGVEVRASGRTPLDRRSSEFRDPANAAWAFHDQPASRQGCSTGGFIRAVRAGRGEGKVTYLRGWPRAKWWASPLLFWDDFSDDGQLGPEASELNGVGSFCLQREIAAGAKAEYTFVLAWHFPNRTPAWCGWGNFNNTATSVTEADPNAIIGNYYSERFRDAWDAAAHTAADLPSLEKRMHQFLTAMRETTIPAPVKEAAMANLSTLVTPTCFRTADGKFRGFEGINDDRGCCHGNCTHVWNYETTTQFLFPALARSMREAAFDLADRLDGMLPIRMALPEGKQTGVARRPRTAPWARSSKPISTGSFPVTMHGCARSGRR